MMNLLRGRAGTSGTSGDDERAGLRPMSRLTGRDGLRPGLEDEVDGGLSGQPDPAEAGLGEQRGEPGRASLRAEGGAARLGERARGADQGRCRVEEPAARVQVVLDV